MIKMINRLTGTEMWVSEDRVEQYKAAGHKLAAVTNEKPVKGSTQSEKKRVSRK